MKKDIEVLIERTNRLHPYVGTWHSSGDDGRRRLALLRPIRLKFKERMKTYESKRQTLFCYEDSIEGIEYLSFWDYLPRGVDSSRVYEINLKSSRGSHRIYIPKELLLPTGALSFVGRIDHFEIWSKDKLKSPKN